MSVIDLNELLNIEASRALTAAQLDRDARWYRVLLDAGEYAEAERIAWEARGAERMAEAA